MVNEGIYELSEILKINHRIPKYQRNFAWTSRNAEELFDDILCYQKYKQKRGDGDRSKYIFGQVIVYCSSNNNYIIDGQQRLITSSLLIAAARKIVNAVDPSAQIKSPVTVFNYSLSPFLYTSLDECKTRLTLSSVNKSYYESILKYNLVSTTRDPSQNNMKSVFETFVLKLYNLVLKERYNEITNYNVLDMNILYGKTEIIKIVQDFIFTFLSFKVIYLINDSLEEAHRVFETTNARGVKLTGTDLSKNYLFSTCYSSESALDDDELNLESIWNATLNSLNNDFTKMFRYALITRVGKISQDDVFNYVKMTFSTPADVEKFIRDFPILTNIYHSVCKKNYVFFNNVDTTRILNSLQPIGVSVYCPIIMSVVLRAILEDRDYETDVYRVVKVIDSCIVRTYMTGEISSNALEEPFDRASMEYYRGNITLVQLINEIVSKTNCNDDDVVQKMKAMSWDNSKYVRYLLSELFNRHNAVVSVPSSADVEHILPQSNDNYSMYWPNINIEQASMYKNKLGNMILLNKSINRSIKDHGFNEKREKYLSEYNMLDVIKDSIVDVPEWSFDTICERTERLVKLIVKTWGVE